MRIHKTFHREELEKLPSDVLDRMLHEELGEETKDAELILALMRILEEREADMLKPDVDEAWQTFVERYNTKIETEPATSKKKPCRWLGIVAAAIAVFFALSFGIPKASGYDNLFKLIASWTDDFFTLSDPDNMPTEEPYVFKTDNPGLQQVYDAVVGIGITEPVVPMWIPEGYELTELRTIPFADGTKVYARFANGQKELSLMYKLYYIHQSFQAPKDEKMAMEYEIEGVSYHFIPNAECFAVTWKNKNVECLLTSELNEDVIKTIILSISGGNIE